MQGRKIPIAVWRQFPKVLAETGGSIATASRQLNIDPRSVYYKINSDPDFARSIQQTYDSTVVPVLEQKMYALAMKDDYRAIRFILSNRAPRRWNTEFVIKAELEIEIEREKKRIKSGEKTYTARYPSLASLIMKKIYTDMTFRKQGVPDILTVDIREEKARYETYRKKREERLKSHPEEGRLEDGQ